MHDPIQAALGSEEEILWRGRPAALPYMLNGLLVTVPLGILTLGSAIYWTRGERILTLPLWAQVILGIVLLTAAQMLVVRPLLSLHLIRRTYYAITDRRALVVYDTFGCTIQQLPHDQGELLVVLGPENTGRIRFARTAESAFDVLIYGRTAAAGFYGLAALTEPLQILRRCRGESVEEALA